MLSPLSGMSHVKENVEKQLRLLMFSMEDTSGAIGGGDATTMSSDVHGMYAAGMSKRK